ncbi:hypothetical protein DY000_02005547 [Brassica cretica]|uniref:Uncharacterized protein n=1 Tax=Brassica cretica TaxID=69181 RepID=A0ABQ7CIN1_BRACR|nr:hypothetical protein DY000_02005547 [Brassica cretica]
MEESRLIPKRRCSPWIDPFYGSRPRSASAQDVPDPSSDVRDPRAAPARDLFLVRYSIRQLASHSCPARVPFVSSSRLNSFGGPIQQSSKVKSIAKISLETD